MVVVGAAVVVVGAAVVVVARQRAQLYEPSMPEPTYCHVAAVALDATILEPVIHLTAPLESVIR